jgi:hypothetical protein
MPSLALDRCMTRTTINFQYTMFAVRAGMVHQLVAVPCIALAGQSTGYSRVPSGANILLTDISCGTGPLWNNLPLLFC